MGNVIPNVALSNKRPNVYTKTVTREGLVIPSAVEYGPELVVDSDMGLAGVAQWTPLSSAVLTKELVAGTLSGQVLRVAYASGASAGTGITVNTTSGSTKNMVRVRSDSSRNFRLRYSSGAIETSIVGTEWQELNLVASVADIDTLVMDMTETAGYFEVEYLTTKEVTTSLVAGYDMVINPAGVVKDVLGGFNGSVLGGVSNGVSSLGSYLSFDSATSGTIMIGQAGASLIDDFALVAWFKTTGVSGGTLISRRIGSDELTTQWHFQASDANGKLFFFVGDQSVTGVKVVNDGDWHLGAVMVNGDRFKLYVDGVFDAETPSVPITTIAGITFIGARNGSGERMNGDILAPQILDLSGVTRAQFEAWIAQQYRDGLALL